MKIKLGNLENFAIDKWLSSPKELFKDFINNGNKEYRDLFGRNYPFIPQYGGQDMLHLMSNEQKRTKAKYVVAEFKFDGRVSKNGELYELELQVVGADVCYGFKFSSKVSEFQILYSNGNDEWESVYEVEEYNCDTVPFTPHLLPMPIANVSKTKFKILFKPEQPRSIIVYTLWGVLDTTGKSKLMSFNGNLGDNMVVNNKKFNVY